MKPKYGVIGCGSISKFHFDALEKIKADVLYVSDIDRGKADFAKRFGAKFTTDYKEVLADKNVTVVSILAPGKLHRDMCISALTAGRDVICEKTLSNSREEAQEIVNAVRKSGRLFFTAYMKRFFPALQKAKELIPSLGTIFSAHIRTYQQWGNLFDAKSGDKYQFIIDNYGGAITKCGGSHTLDLMMYLLGRPEKVFAKIIYIDKSDVDIKTSAIFEYKKPLVVNFETSTHPLDRIGYERKGWDERLEIIGTEGKLEIHTVEWGKSENNPALLIHYDNKQKMSNDYKFPAVNTFNAELEYFDRCLSEKTQGKPDVIDGFNVDSVISSIEESDRKGMAVLIDWKNL